MRAADPADKRWRVHRPNDDRARDPSPKAAVIDPAAIVTRCEAPGRVVNPCPTPRFEPYPVSKAIGRPSRGHYRDPDRPVGGYGTPSTVIVEVFVAYDSGRNVLSRD